MRAGSKSVARMRPRLGLARLISAITAGFPARDFSRNAAANPRGGSARAARVRISAGGTAALARSTSRRLASRMRFRMSDTSGLGEAVRELHELVELLARRPAG